MTAATNSRLSSGTTTPSHATLPIASNTILWSKTIVCINAAGEAVNPADGDAVEAVGIAKQTFDNRTGALTPPTNAEIALGAWGGFVIDGTVPLNGQMLYVVDNQTVSIDSLGGTRGKAGPCSKVSNGQAFVVFSPGAGGARGDGYIATTIGMAPAWGDGTANGFDPVKFAYGLNPATDDEPLLMSISLPGDLDPGFDMTVTVRASISSIATDNDVTVLMMARIDGGTDLAPINAAVLSVAAQNIDFTIPKASISAGAKALYLEIDCAGTLDTADAYIFAVDIKYTKTS